MKTSVVLSAYNGEKFILEQLESIRIQTVPVDEVIILDDCSTDNTAKICQDFITQHNLSHWHFEVNTQNKGFVQNFYAGFQKATGEIIFICDQDDIWRPNKVERTKYFFTNHPDALSICSAFSRFWEDQILNTHIVSPNRKRNSIKKITLNEFSFFYGYLGMSTAFKKELLKYDYKTCIQNITYDIAINFIAVLHNGLYYLDEVLVDRRSYPLSTSNNEADNETKKYFQGNKRLYTLSKYMSTLQSFCSFIDITRNIEHKANLHFKKRIAETQKRINAVKINSIPKLFVLLFTTKHRYSAKKILGDIIFLLNNRKNDKQ